MTKETANKQIEFLKKKKAAQLGLEVTPVQPHGDSSRKYFVSTDAVVWAESQPRSGVRLSLPSAHLQSHFTNGRQGHYSTRVNS